MFLSTNIGAASPGPADDFWYTQIGTPPVAGARVNALTAMQLSTVYKCVRAIAETLSMLPLPVYRRLERGKQKVPDHPIARLLRTPNPWQTEMQFRQMLQGHACLRGNGYAEVIFSGAGREEMLIPLHPDRVKVEVLENGLPRYRVTDERGRERILVFGQVLHLQGFALDGYVGLNPIEAERESIGAAIVMRDYGTRFFGNSARPPTWIEAPGQFKDDAARRKWVADYQASFGGQNAGKSPVFENGMKLHALPINNTDAQWLEARKAQDIDIAGIFRVPPHKIGILDRATWSNIEHQALEFVTDCIMPWCVRWEQALHRDLMFGEEFFAEHLIDMLLRGDTKSRFEAYGKGIQDGWLTRNEAREKENLNPLDGLDTPLEPMNMAPAGSRGASQARGQQPDARISAVEARALAIQTAAAERIARKESAALQKALRTGDVPLAIDAALGEQHARFVSEVLAIDISTAVASCQAAAERLKAAHADGTLAKTLPADLEAVRVPELCRLGESSDEPVSARDLLGVVKAVAQRPVHINVQPTPPRSKEIDRDENGFIRQITEREVLQ